MSLTNLNDSILGYWPLNGPLGGTTWPAHRGDHDFVSNVDPVSSTTGKINNAVALTNAAEDHLEIQDATFAHFDGSTDFSCCGWVKQKASSASDTGVFGVYGDNLTVVDQRAWQIFWDNTPGVYRAVVSSTGGANSADISVSAVTETNWNFLYLQWTAATDTLLLRANGGAGGLTVSAVASAGTIFNSSVALRIGYFEISNNDGWADADFDEWALWGRVLTSDEVDSIYNSGSGVDLRSYIDANTSGGGNLSHYNRIQRRKARYGSAT